MKLDKISIQNGFNKAATTYDMAAIAQKEIGRRLISRLNYLKLKPKNILDLGCGNGYFTNELQNIYPYAKVYGLDFADKALVIAKEKYSKIEFIHADMDDFYAKEEKFDLIFSTVKSKQCHSQWVTREVAPNRCCSSLCVSQVEKNRR